MLIIREDMTMTGTRSDGVEIVTYIEADLYSKLKELIEQKTAEEEGTQELIKLIPEEVLENNVEIVSKIVPLWRAGSKYSIGDFISMSGTVYKVLQDHTSQSDWTPDKSPSLFAPLLTSPTGEVLEWVQPDSTNPYMKGDRVKYNGKVYESLIDNNVWSPEAYPAGWTEVP